MKHLSACIIVLLLCGAVCSDAPSTERGDWEAASAGEFELSAWVAQVERSPKPDVRGPIALGVPFRLEGPPVKGRYCIAEGRLLRGEAGKYRLPLTLTRRDRKGEELTRLTAELEIALDDPQEWGFASGIIRWSKVQLTRPARK
jgi:hypothetical protein